MMKTIGNFLHSDGQNLQAWSQMWLLDQNWDTARALLCEILENARDLTERKDLTVLCVSIVISQL